MAQTKHGTGTIYQNKQNGKYIWQGSYVDEFGKKHRPIKTFETEAEALRFQAEQFNQKEVKKRKAKKDLTFSELYEEWKEAVKNGSVKLAESTRKNSISNINTHIIPIIGDNSINKISTLKLNRYFNSLLADDTSQKTIYNIFTDFKKVYNYGVEKKYIYNDCLDDFNIKNEPTHKVVNTLELHEYEQIINCEENKKSFYYNHIVFLGETGIRVEELAITDDDLVIDTGIEYVDINKSITRALQKDDKKTKLVVVNYVKNNASYRRVPLNRFAFDALIAQDLYKINNNIQSDFKFCNTKGGLLEKRNLLRAFHKFCENAGVEKRGLHSLRKVFINRALQEGITPFDLAKITGHSVQTMFKYYHSLDNTTLIKVAEATEKGRETLIK